MVGLCALLGAGVTGFYMTRLMLMTFFTEKRWEKDVHPHESPEVMTVPLIVLAALSVLGGVLLARRLDRRLPRAGRRHAEHEEPPIPAIADHLITRRRRRRRRRGRLVPRRQARGAPRPRRRTSRSSPAPPAHDLYGDAINEGLVVEPGRRLVAGLSAFDRYGADGIFTAAPVGSRRRRRSLRKVQNGYVRSYALSVLVGVLIVVLALLAVNLA